MVKYTESIGVDKSTKELLKVNHPLSKALREYVAATWKEPWFVSYVVKEGNTLHYQISNASTHKYKKLTMKVRHLKI